jgi:hypothetical protein
MKPKLRRLPDRDGTFTPQMRATKPTPTPTKTPTKSPANDWWDKIVDKFWGNTAFGRNPFIKKTKTPKVTPTPTRTPRP